MIGALTSFIQILHAIIKVHVTPLLIVLASRTEPIAKGVVAVISKLVDVDGRVVTVFEPGHWVALVGQTVVHASERIENVIRSFVENVKQEINSMIQDA